RGARVVGQAGAPRVVRAREVRQRAAVEDGLRGAEAGAVGEARRGLRALLDLQREVLAQRADRVGRVELDVGVEAAVADADAPLDQVARLRARDVVHGG